MPRIVCLSDTHNCNEQIDVPDGDLLIHSGDATISGTTLELQRFLDWYSSLPHESKILIAGNHDWAFQLQPEAAVAAIPENVIYLRDSSTEIDGLKIYGSPWQPRFFDWAFNLDRGPEIAEKWKLIPEDTDVLITHGPPSGILDRTPAGDNAGCEELRKRVEKIRPKLHIFGHIHMGYGHTHQFGVTFVNACICDEAYRPGNPPIVIDL
jgi:predicted phosphohydrolase